MDVDRYLCLAPREHTDALSVCDCTAAADQQQASAGVPGMAAAATVPSLEVKAARVPGGGNETAAYCITRVAGKLRIAVSWAHKRHS